MKKIFFTVITIALCFFASGVIKADYAGIDYEYGKGSAVDYKVIVFVDDVNAIGSSLDKMEYSRTDVANSKGVYKLRVQSKGGVVKDYPFDVPIGTYDVWDDSGLIVSGGALGSSFSVLVNIPTQLKNDVLGLYLYKSGKLAKYVLPCRPECTGGAVCDTAKGKCVCTKFTCDGLGKKCGTWSDNCGGTISCGAACSGDNPVAYYPFDGDSKDLSGNGNNATANNTATGDGISDKALSFNGTNSFVELPLVKNLALGNEITLITWVKKSAVSVGALEGLMQRGYYSSGDASQEYLLRLNSGKPEIIFGDGSKNDTISGTTRVDDDKWHMVAATLKPDNTVQVYVDGNLVGSGKKTANWSNNVSVKQYIGVVKNMRYYKGLMDEVSIYNKALSQDAIKQIYTSISGNAVPTPTATPATPEPAVTALPVAEFHFDDKNPTDASGNGNDGTSSNAGLSSNAKFGNRSYIFNGVNSYISIPPSASLALGNEMTIALWVSRNKGGTGSGGVIEGLIKRGKNSTDPKYQEYLIRLNSGVPELVFGDGTKNSDIITGSGRIDDGKWHFIVAILRSDGTVELRVDEGTYTPVKGKKTVSWFGNSNVQLIGATKDNAQFFLGLIDEVKIYNKALTDAEIAKLYKNNSLAQSSFINIGFKSAISNWFGNISKDANLFANMLSTIFGW